MTDQGASKAEGSCEELLTTFFASPERDPEEKLRQALRFATSNPIVDAALKAFGGLIAVLNQHRQVLALNTALLEELGIEDPEQVLGLRPGEVLGCVHSAEAPAGCGTSRACRSCGAAIAMVACLDRGAGVSEECVITLERGGERTELSFKIRATPLDCDEERLILLFLEDQTDDKRRRTLERAFYHDICNTIQALCGMTELLAMEGGAPIPSSISKLSELADRLNKEVQIQRALTMAKSSSYQIHRQRTTASALLRELEHLVATHPLAGTRRLVISTAQSDASLVTDTSLALRVLTNMVVNALEASSPGDEVRVRLGDSDDSMLRFEVWNAGIIHEDVAIRVFERHFSTKPGAGRGTGTYAMKLFGETMLGGKVSFSSKADEGTTFTLALRRD
jgi:PAS domain-containing protein